MSAGLARGDVSGHEHRMLVGDRNDEVIENRGSVPAGGMAKADREAKAQASEPARP
jgi:hypothetical protein